jgi:hypothetical protein
VVIAGLTQGFEFLANLKQYRPICPNEFMAAGRMSEPIDLEHLDKYVFGDRALLDEILSIFIDQVSILVERMNVEAEDVDWREAAHTLKGASRGVGAFRLGDLAAEAECMVGPTGRILRGAHVPILADAAQQAVDFARRRREKTG